MPRTHAATAVQSGVSLPHIIALLALAVMLSLFSVLPANAASEDAPAPEVAMMPLALPQAPVSILVGCDAGVAVFSVQNNTSRWASRGFIRIVDGQTGTVLRERELALGERQQASFRVATKDAQMTDYRVLVRMPDGGMTYVKSFSGSCR